MPVITATTATLRDAYQKADELRAQGHTIHSIILNDEGNGWDIRVWTSDEVTD